MPPKGKSEQADSHVKRPFALQSASLSKKTNTQNPSAVHRKDITLMNLLCKIFWEGSTAGPQSVAKFDRPRDESIPTLGDVTAVFCPEDGPSAPTPLF